MRGLREEDIKKIQAEGRKTITVKAPFPFVPIILGAYVWVLVTIGVFG
jgi:hypothetical protein